LIHHAVIRYNLKGLKMGIIVKENECEGKMAVVERLIP